MDASLEVTELAAARHSSEPPLLIDVRREAAYRSDTALIAGALRRDPEDIGTWGAELAPGTAVVVYCAHGHEVSRDAARTLAARGLAARYLGGGIAAWKAAGGPLLTKPAGAGTRWITRERPKIDRIACPWLVARFIDRDAEFVYVPARDVMAEAQARCAIPYDVPDVAYAHAGDRCSFDAFLRLHALADPALAQLARIVRGADTGHPELAPEAAGLLAVSLGLGRLYGDDHALLARGMVLYDALYAWCRSTQTAPPHRTNENRR